MKTGNYNIQWFEKEDARKVLRASVSKDGKIHLGQGLREQLSPYIRIGFDTKNRVLAIARGNEGDICWPKIGVFNMRSLAAQIAEVGLKLPVSFNMVMQANDDCFFGRVIPQRSRQWCNGGWRFSYDIEQLMVLYQPVIDNVVYHVAKSTPLAERKSCATEAFYKAVQGYTSLCGDMEAYIKENIRCELVQNNKIYVNSYRDQSMDTPLANDGDNTFRLHDIISDASNGGIEQIEKKIMGEQFINSLQPEERQLFEMMCSGFQVPHIAMELGIGEEEVLEMGKDIGKKRLAFYNAE